ncbi:MAG: ABC transporter permease [Parvularculaceae bacterium]
MKWPLLDDAGFRAGAIIVAAFIAMAILSLVWTPYSVTAIDAASRLAPPSLAHWLGTNPLGRDVLSLIMAGARTTILVAATAVALGMALGVPLGLLASARGGVTDDAVMRASDVIFAFPALILAILLTAINGPGSLNAIIAIGVFNIPVFARLARGAALPIWTRGFVQSARTSGLGQVEISLRHILPNVAPALIVQGTVQFSLAVLAEAGLSYVGLGAQPPAASWGRMLAESQTLIVSAPWLTIFPGVAIFLFVLGLNLMGDGLRRRIDPHQRGAL